MRTMAVGLLGLCLIGVVPEALGAQDSVLVEGRRAAQLREMIEARFAQRLATELSLTGEQSVKVRVILSNWAAKRRLMEQQEQRTRQTLTAAMRPGVAADEAAVTKLVDDLLNSRMAYVQSFKEELADLAPLLTPVQRAQYVLLRDRLLQRVQDVRNQRAGEPQTGPARRVRPPQ